MDNAWLKARKNSSIFAAFEVLLSLLTVLTSRNYALASIFLVSAALSIIYSDNEQKLQAKDLRRLLELLLIFISGALFILLLQAF